MLQKAQPFCCCRNVSLLAESICSGRCNVTPSTNKQAKVSMYSKSFCNVWVTCLNIATNATWSKEHRMEHCCIQELIKVLDSVNWKVAGLIPDGVIGIFH